MTPDVTAQVVTLCTTYCNLKKLHFVTCI